MEERQEMAKAQQDDELAPASPDVLPATVPPASGMGGGLGISGGGGSAEGGIAEAAPVTAPVIKAMQAPPPVNDQEKIAALNAAGAPSSDLYYATPDGAKLDDLHGQEPQAAAKDAPASSDDRDLQEKKKEETAVEADREPESRLKYASKARAGADSADAPAATVGGIPLFGMARSRGNDATGAGTAIAAPAEMPPAAVAALPASPPLPPTNEVVAKADISGVYQQAQQKNLPASGDISVTGHVFRVPGPLRPAPVPPSQDEISAADQPYSTFSLHVSDVSFLLARAALARGQMPDPASIRPEEFYNAFDYGDPAPATGEKIACHIEQAAHPFLQQRNLVRIAMKVAATGRGQGQPLRLTVLLDTSGSMEREDRAASVRRAMEVLTSLLGPNDAVTLIGFARQPRLLAEEVPGDKAATLADLVKRTPPEGGTNMEEAIKLASELALRHFEPGGQNRVVMLTDGAANLGDADPTQLSKLVERLRQQGVSFDACGVGADGLDDDILEALTRKGGGRYYFINGPQDADEGFARQLAGAFRPAAENVKMQVRFNPARVGNYRLIGFEKHRLNQEDFRNDKVTAAQLAAEEAAVALYQVQVLPEGEGEVGEVFVRFRDPSNGRMVEQSWTIPYDAQAPALDKAPPSMQLAATAAMLAEKLRGGPAGDAVDLNALAPVVDSLRGDYARQERVQELIAMFEEARRMTGATTDGRR